MTEATSPDLRISIVVPSFNQAAFLGRTLDSIFGQEVAPFEVIVADGGSTDGSVELLKAYAERFDALQWLSEPDNGPADAVNKGLRRVTGDIVGIQSSDDVYYPGSFSAVLRCFETNPDCGFVYGDLEDVDAEDYVLCRKRMPDFSWPAIFAMSMCLAQSSIFFRSHLINEVGLWNPDYYGCDLDYWMRLLFRTQAVHIAKPLSGWRRYDEQRTRPEQNQRIWNDYWRMIDTSTDVAVAPPAIKRLAQASKHLLVFRFPPDETRSTLWIHVFKALILFPGFWRYYRVRMLVSRLLPGFEALRSVYLAFRQRAGMQEARRKAELPTPMVMRHETD